jgi:carbon storage regulator
MLVLSRKAGEEIAIDGIITIRVLSVERGVVRLGIEAPRGVAIYRRELYQAVEQLNRNATTAELPPLVAALRRTRLYPLPLQTVLPTIFPEQSQPLGTDG